MAQFSGGYSLVLAVEGIAVSGCGAAASHEVRADANAPTDGAGGSAHGDRVRDRLRGGLDDDGVVEEDGSSAAGEVVDKEGARGGLRGNVEGCRL